jgi:hypothetical protein
MIVMEGKSGAGAPQSKTSRGFLHSIGFALVSVKDGQVEAGAEGFAGCD